jgi:hypothetical protein
MSKTGRRPKDRAIHGPAEKRAVKQPYRRPIIEEYGDIKDITQRVGFSGRRDGGSFPNRTSVLDLLG